MLKRWMPDVDSPCKCRKVSRCNAMPLNSACVGKRFRVAGIEGGRQLCARMASMGIYPGVQMEVLCSGCGSPCLVRVGGGTLSLGAGVSDKILVTPDS
jgi:ferrous iron transport protein A